MQCQMLWNREATEAKPRPDYVVVHHVDRWARNGQDHDMMRNYLLKLGVKLRSFSQRLGEDPYDQFYERIMSGQAELDNKLRGMRSVAGMKTRVQGVGGLSKRRWATSTLRTALEARP